MDGDIPWHYVALVVIAFISWLFNRIQEATAERRRLHELRRRREEQKNAPQPTRRETSSSPPPIPQGRRPATRHEPEEKAEEILRDLFEALGGPPQEAPEPVRPRPEQPRERPKPPPITRKPVEETPQHPTEPVLSAAEKAALERVKTGRAGVSGVRRRTADSQANFRRLLRSSGGLRQAVIVKEILDAPLALRDDPASGRETA